MNNALRERPKPEDNALGGRKANIFLTLFGIFWCSLVGVFDYILINNLTHQIASTSFLPTSAHIVSSRVTSGSDSDGGDTHGVAFEYTYSVNGKTYIGNRYTFDSSSSSDSKWADEAVANFPAGSERTCYYNPRDPSQAVLAPGLHGSDITFLMFITPFNIVGAFFIAYPIWAWRDRRKPTIVSPRVCDRLHGREAYSLNDYSPLLTFIGAFLITTFLGTFAVIFPYGFHPTMTKVLTIWGIAFALAVAISIYVYLKTQSGRYDLVFDQNARTITIPAIKKRQSVETILISAVKKFDTTRVEVGSGDEHKVTWELKLITDAGREVLLHESYLELQAKRMAETLNAKLQS